jgi:MFS family permease
VLAIAAWLTPAPEGYGTHQQLGLSACTMLSLTGWPCPMCGMTTTFALLADGRVSEAFANQPFGPVLFGLTATAASGGVLDMMTGRGVVRGMTRRAFVFEGSIALMLLAGLIGGWIYKCVRMHPEIFGG